MSDPYADIAAPADPYAGIATRAPARRPKRSVVQDVTGAMAQVNRGLGIGDEMAAGVQTGVNVLAGRVPVQQAGEGYRNALAAQRGYESDFAAERPRAAALAQGTGMAGTALVPGGATTNALATGGRAVNMARGAVTAAGTGAAYAAADAGTGRERIKAASDAALNPLNIVLGGLAGRGAAPPKAKPGKPAALPELQKARTAAYKAIEASGERYTAEGFAGLVGNIKRDLAAARFDPDFHPVVATMVKKLDEKVKQGYAPSLADLDDLRKMVGENVAGNVDKNTRRLGGHVIRAIDGFTDKAAGSETLKKARDLHKRVSKIEAVNDAVDKAGRQAKATYSGGNIENATRQKLNKVLEKQSNLTADERAALEEIVNGSKSANALRQVGKFSPSGNGLSQWFNLGAVATAGPAGLAVPIIGAAAKGRGEAMQRAKVAELVDLIAAGGSREQLQAIQRRVQSVEGPAGSALRKMVATKLARASGVATAGAQPSASPAR